MAKWPWIIVWNPLPELMNRSTTAVFADEAERPLSPTWLLPRSALSMSRRGRPLREAVQEVGGFRAIASAHVSEGCHKWGSAVLGIRKIGSKKRVNKRSNRRTLGKDDEKAKHQQEDQHWHYPPQLPLPEKPQEL